MQDFIKDDNSCDSYCPCGNNLCESSETISLPDNVAARRTLQNGEGFLSIGKQYPEGLRGIKFSDKDDIIKYIDAYPSQSCENSFANVFMWGRAYDTKILRWKERIVLYNSLDGLLHYPLGAPTPPQELFELASKFCRASLLRLPYIYDIPQDYPNLFPEAQDYFDMVADPADFDYLYRLPNLVNLVGSKLRKKRNHIKRFIVGNPNFRIEEIDSKNIWKAREFIRRIDMERGLQTEMQAIDCGVENFERLSLKGIILYSEAETIAGVAIFSRLNDSTWAVHFEKSLHDLEGAPQFLVKCEAETLTSLSASIMNREQDLGDEHLRRAKDSLDPFDFYRRMRAYFNKAKLCSK